MRRTVRGTLLVLLCGGCLFQGGCGGIIAPLIFQLGGSLLFRGVLDAILGPAQ